MGKAVSARAPFSPLARRLFANPETRREMLRHILSGVGRFTVAGHTFCRRAERHTPEQQEGRS